MNDKGERMWKESVVAYLKVQPWYLPVWAEENHENTQSG
jgi:hypothetical protein